MKNRAIAPIVVALGAAVCMASGARASQSEAASRDLAAFARAWSGITAYSATVAMVDHKGAQSQNVVFDYMAGQNVGVTLSWDGGPTVIARRGSGFAALFRRTLSLHDPLVTTLRGSSIDQVSFGAILAQGQHDADSLSEAPGEVIGGVRTDAVTLTRAWSSADDEPTREVVELSAVTHLPMRVLSYEGSALVQDVEFSNIKLER
jgi:hypothetical protein